MEVSYYQDKIEKTKKLEEEKIYNTNKYFNNLSETDVKISNSPNTYYRKYKRETKLWMIMELILILKILC